METGYLRARAHTVPEPRSSSVRRVPTRRALKGGQGAARLRSLIAHTHAGTDYVVGDLGNSHGALQSPFQCPQQAQTHQAADPALIEGHNYGTFCRGKLTHGQIAGLLAPGTSAEIHMVLGAPAGAAENCHAGVTYRMPTRQHVLDRSGEAETADGWQTDPRPLGPNHGEDFPAGGHGRASRPELLPKLRQTLVDRITMPIRVRILVDFPRGPAVLSI